MSRDLFKDTFTARPVPQRSKWMIVASFLAHAGVACALLIIPILSAADAFVLRANDAFVVALPVVVVPASPPPVATQLPAPTNINPDAAPREPPEHEVTVEVPRAPAGPPGLIDLRVRQSGGDGTIPGAPEGAPSIVLTQPPQRPSGPIRPGGDIKPPERIAFTAAFYPTIAKTARIEGRVIVEATIDEQGAVRDVRVLRSDPLFDQAAIDAVTKWRYTPTKLNGVPVSILLTVIVTFTLK